MAARKSRKSSLRRPPAVPRGSLEAIGLWFTPEGFSLSYRTCNMHDPALWGDVLARIIVQVSEAIGNESERSIVVVRREMLVALRNVLEGATIVSVDDSDPEECTTGQIIEAFRRACKDEPPARVEAVMLMLGAHAFVKDQTNTHIDFETGLADFLRHATMAFGQVRRNIVDAAKGES